MISMEQEILDFVLSKGDIMASKEQIDTAVEILEKERQAMDEILDKAGWEKHVSSSLRQDTGINLVTFSRRSDPEWEYKSQGGSWTLPLIDYNEDDCTWMSYKEGYDTAGEGTGAESLGEYLKGLDNGT